MPRFCRFSPTPFVERKNLFAMQHLDLLGRTGDAKPLGPKDLSALLTLELEGQVSGLHCDFGTSQ